MSYLLRAVLISVGLSSPLMGCSAQVRLKSVPSGASFEQLDRRTGEVVSRCLAPCDIRMPYQPGRAQPWRVQLPGRETMVIDLMRTEGRALRWIGGGLFQKGGREITVVLLPPRSPVGTPEPRRGP